MHAYNVYLVLYISLVQLGCKCTICHNNNLKKFFGVIKLKIYLLTLSVGNLRKPCLVKFLIYIFEKVLSAGDSPVKQ